MKVVLVLAMVVANPVVRQLQAVEDAAPRKLAEINNDRHCYVQYTDEKGILKYARLSQKHSIKVDASEISCHTTHCRYNNDVNYFATMD